MKIKIALIGVIVILAGLSLMAEPEPAQEHEPIDKPIRILLPPVANEAFGAGEKQRFKLSYEFINAGEASMEVREAEPINGRPTLFIESIAKSNKFIDVFFKVRDYNASQVDKASLASINFIQNLREGKYKVFRKTSIDYETGTFVKEKQYKGKTKIRKGVVPGAMSDILSAFYFARTFPLEPGKVFKLDVFSDKAIYPLEVHVDKKLHKIKVPAGKFECLKVTPKYVGDAIFKAKDGKMTIYMTNDQHKMPVLLKSKVFIGSFDGELVEYTLASK